MQQINATVTMSRNSKVKHDLVIVPTSKGAEKIRKAVESGKFQKEVWKASRSK